MIEAMGIYVNGMAIGPRCDGFPLQRIVNLSQPENPSHRENVKFAYLRPAAKDF